MMVTTKSYSTLWLQTIILLPIDGVDNLRLVHDHRANCVSQQIHGHHCARFADYDSEQFLNIVVQLPKICIHVVIDQKFKTWKNHMYKNDYPKC